MYKPMGIISAIVTPMEADTGKINFEELLKLVDFQIGHGVTGIMALGTSGEFFNLDVCERVEVVRNIVDHLKGRIPVIAGVLCPGIKDSVELARRFEDAGATAILALPPYYTRPSLKGIVDHYRILSECIGIPIIVYNNPGRTNININVPMLEQLVELDGIVGMKDCDRDVASISEKIIRFGDRMIILSGDDDLGFATFMLGSNGAIWATPNLFPDKCVQLLKFVQKCEIERAKMLHNQMLPMIKSWSIPNHPGPLKEAMNMLGWNVGFARNPLQRITKEQALRIKKELDKIVLARQ